jgi:mannose-6-phosphate isomerase-like protein (cupin superfamily)
MDRPFALNHTYVHLQPDGQAQRVEVDERFWATIGERTELHRGYRVTRATMNDDWPHWEMHPEGEELVVLLKGAMDLVLDDGARQWTVELRPGSETWINPRGVWHRGVVHQPSEVLFATAGRGTRHRPV